MRMLAKKPVATNRVDLSTPVTTSAWTLIISAMTAATSAVEIFNGSGSILQISTGTPGNEAAGLIPYQILPGGSSILLPSEFSKGIPVSVKAVDQNTSQGSLILNFFG